MSPVRNRARASAPEGPTGRAISNGMRFIPVRTRKLLPPKDDVYSVLDESLPRLCEGDIVFITSKILAIHQGRCVKIGKNIDKRKLVLREADRYVENRAQYWDFILTIKDSTLIPSSGIDESNGNGYYILWPKRTNAFLKEIRAYLKKKYKLKNLAVVATDSHAVPLRWGISGISTGFYGLEPLRDKRGARDIFGRKLKYTRINIPDALAAMAVFIMGEAGERTPIIILRGMKGIQFTDKSTWHKVAIPPRKDLYAPILKEFRTP